MAMPKTSGKLVSAPSNMTDPRTAKFSASSPKMGADMQGADSLLKLSPNQKHPADAEASNFTPQVSKAESGTDVSVAASVSLKSGKHTC